MISYDEALKLVLDAVRSLGVENVPLLDADGRFLARPLKARLDMPRFDQSAMDGFAVKLDDIAGASLESPAELILDGDLPAGAMRRPRLRQGHTFKVFTGSMLPAGTEAVVMREYSREQGVKVLLERNASPGEHLRLRGEEYKKGDRLLDGGVRIDPATIGLLANSGYTEVPVFVRPTVTLLTIGDELVPLGAKLLQSKIYNSNELALTAALTRVGVVRIRARTLPDDPAAMRREMSRGLRDSDILLTAGGASEGDYDFVPRVATELGVKERFKRVAIKPGKPNFFGTWRAPGRTGRTRLVFGLPGNAVSALVSFYQLVRPALLRMMGLPAPTELDLSAELTEDCNKKKGRLEWLRGRLEVVDGRLLVHPSTRQGSHMMGGLALADCLIHFPLDRELLKKGEQVDVRQIHW
jgi:molybdopterin molybdotransferase